MLLVEDNQQVFGLRRAAAQELQCTVVVAEDSHEALAALEVEDVDAVFTDVMMRGMSGVELMKCIRTIHPELPVVLATGYSHEGIGSAALEFELVSKPC